MGSVLNIIPWVSHIRFLLKSLAEARVITICLPALRAISAALRFNTLTVPPPTVPSPSTPTFTGFKLSSS